MKRKRGAWFRFLAFFISTAFVVSCNMILFLTPFNLDEETVRRAAPVTMANVILIVAIFYVIDKIRYYFSVEKPIRLIKESIDKAISGDFSVRIPEGSGLMSFDGYDEITSELNKLFSELNSVETLRTDFISSVSHELKTPMAVIQNYGTLLQAPGLPEEKRIEYSRKITGQTRKLSGMVTNILRLNKLENQSIFTDMQQIDLSEHVCESVLIYEEVWEKRGLNVETVMEDGVRVMGDSEMLALVWNNLMSNAMKFTEDGGNIKISISRNNGKAVVEVSDTGCGMTPETGARIFQKFYQGDTSHASEGNGLGLSLVKRIIDIHGGEISVSSELGRGSTFKVSLDFN